MVHSAQWVSSRHTVCQFSRSQLLGWSLAMVFISTWVPAAQLFGCQIPDPPAGGSQPAATSPDDLLARGDALFTEGLFDRALARYKEAQSLAPSDLRVQNRLAQTHLKLGNRGAGLAALGLIFAAKPELKDNDDLVELRRQLEALPAAVATATGKPSPATAPDAPASAATVPGVGGNAAMPTEPLLAQRTTDVALAARSASLELGRLKDAKDETARQGILDSAWSALRPALAEFDIDNAEAWRAAAVIALGRQDRDLAAVAYEGIIRLQPDAASANSQLSLLAGLQNLGAKVMKANTPEKKLVHELRKAVAWYTRGLHGSAHVRTRTFEVRDPESVRTIGNDYFVSLLASKNVGEAVVDPIDNDMSEVA